MIPVEEATLFRPFRDLSKEIELKSGIDLKIAIYGHKRHFNGARDSILIFFERSKNSENGGQVGSPRKTGHPATNAFRHSSPAACRLLPPQVPALYGKSNPHCHVDSRDSVQSLSCALGFLSGVAGYPYSLAGRSPSILQSHALAISPLRC